MTSWYFCKKCKIWVVGYQSNSCMLCNKLLISKILQYRNYCKGMLGIQLPLHIIQYISKIAIEINLRLMRFYNELCWKVNMGSLLLKNINHNSLSIIKNNSIDKNYFKN